MIKKDLEIQETNELRNSLEGYVLEMRSKLESELTEYIKDGPRQQFLKELNDMEDWLYEDSYEADKAVFSERLKKLKTIGEPVERRYKEAKNRPQVISGFYRAITESKALLESPDKKYDHIPKEDKEKGLKKCTEAKEWLEKELSKQDPLTLADDPVVVCESI